MRTLKSIVLTLLLVIVLVGGSALGTMYAIDKGWIPGPVIVEEPDANVPDEGATADWMNADSEPVFPYIIPADGPAVSPAKFAFSYNGKSYSVAATVDSRVYHGAVAAKRGYQVSADADENELQGAMISYYNTLAYDPEMENSIESLLTAFRTIKSQAQLDSDQYAELLVKFVQSIPYDVARGSAIAAGSEAGDPRMPVQVLVDGKADCDEKVLLMATLLTHEGYDCTAFFFEAEKHMALGLLDTSQESLGFGDGSYFYVETTGPVYISEVPTNFIGGFSLSSDPIMIPFGNVDPDTALGYSKDAFLQVERIIEKRDSAEAAADQQKTYLESTALSSAKFKTEEAKYKACFTALNSFRETVDAKGKPTGEFMDRPAAIKWLDKHCWW